MRNKIGSLLGMMVAVVLITGAVVVSGCAAPEKPAGEPAATVAEEQAAVEEVEYLFVQHAEGVTLQDGLLTLEGIGEDVLYFSDRPHRVVGRKSVEWFVEGWDEGEDSFQTNPPNAVLTLKQEDELRDLTVVLKNPVLTDRTLVYEVEVLDGAESGSGSFAALFIDVIGSPAGARGEVRRTARRTSRRTARRVDRRQDRWDEEYDDDQDYDDGPYDNNSELEERLRELDDLLDQGLITQEDYDREKEELLREN
jgi:hypothetical protein